MIPRKPLPKSLRAGLCLAATIAVLGGGIAWRLHSRAHAVQLATLPNLYPTRYHNSLFHWRDRDHLIRLQALHTYTYQQTQARLTSLEVDVQTSTLTQHLDSGVLPYWTDTGNVAASPQGPLAFSVCPSFGREIVLTNAEGGNRRRMPLESRISTAFWHPDGHHLYTEKFPRSPSGTMEICIYDTENPKAPPRTLQYSGFDQHDWPSMLGIDTSGVVTALSTQGENIMGRRPNGFYLYYPQPTSPPTAAAPRHELTIVRFQPTESAPSAPVTVVKIPVPAESNEAQLVLSPDGTQLVLVTRQYDPPNTLSVFMEHLFSARARQVPRFYRQRVFICRADGTDLREWDDRTFRGASPFPYPTWSPDSQSVHFFVNSSLYRLTLPAR